MSGAVQNIAKVVQKAQVLDLGYQATEASNRAIRGSDFVKNDKLLRDGAATLRDPAQDAIGAAAEGKGASGALSASAGKSSSNLKRNMGNISAGINPQAAPATIVAEDPAAVQSEAEKKKARAKRQAEIDILTDRPGRGGTILTDQYTYNV